MRLRYAQDRAAGELPIVGLSGDGPLPLRARCGANFYMDESFRSPIAKANHPLREHEIHVHGMPSKKMEQSFAEEMGRDVDVKDLVSTRRTSCLPQSPKEPSEPWLL